MKRLFKPALLSLCLLKSVEVYSVSYSWANPASGVWNLAANWTPNTLFPNTVNDSANFGSVFTGPGTLTVTVTGSLTIGSMQFDNVFNYTVADMGGTQITMGSMSVPSTINVTSLSGSHTISEPLQLANGLTITQASTGLFTISGVISETGGSQSVTIAGTQTVKLSGVNSYSGGTKINSGVLQVLADTALGATTGAVTIATGTFQAGGSFATDVARGFVLTGAANIDTQAFNLTIPGIVSGAGSLMKIGAGGTLILQGANTYQGGTTINAGTLSVSSDGNLGNTSGSVNIGNNATLAVTASFNSARNVGLTGSATINTGANTLGLSGVISGTGALVKAGAGTLILTGTNTYSGGTTISGGTLQGNTKSLPGNIVNNGTSLVFNQTFPGTYSGSLSGASPMTIQGGSVLTMTGNSSGFSGTTALTSGQLVMNGNLSNSALTMSAGTILSGSGSVGTTSNSGQISPGSSGSGTLSFNGNLTFNVGSSALIQITPTTSGAIAVSGTANVTNGSATIQPLSGFYGLTSHYTILTAGVVAGTFSPVTSTDSNFAPTLIYTPTSISLTVTTLRPFLGVPFANSNERAVGENINAINVSGTMTADMASVVNALVGQSFAVVDDALDQMHPATMSAFAELQFETGGQLLSLFHRRPTLLCGCSGPDRLWVEPFGNWLEEKQQGQQIGFHATTHGVALGYDREFFDAWTIGVAGGWNSTHLKWNKERGYAYTTGLVGGVYTDLSIDDFYIGTSCYAGVDWYETSRKIHFTTIDRQASANYTGLDIGWQLTSAYYFGTPACLFYPYATLDYLYLNNSSFSETGANSLDLRVNDYTSSTLRTEAGLAFQVIDKNYHETMCISPLVAFGWVMEMPLSRNPFTVRFADQTIPFKVKGWDQTDQLLNLRFGLGITYKCFTLDSQYILDISPEGGGPFLNQRANFRLNYNF